MINSGLNMKGVINIYQGESKDKLKKIHTIKNTFTAAGKDNIIDSLKYVNANSTNKKIGFFSVGSGDSVSSSASATVEGEYYRAEIDVQESAEYDGKKALRNDLILNLLEGNGTVKKIGLLVHRESTLTNYDAAVPGDNNENWLLHNIADVFLPTGITKTNQVVLKFEWFLVFE